jgi:hypothetical protein
MPNAKRHKGISMNRKTIKSFALGGAWKGRLIAALGGLLAAASIQAATITVTSEQDPGDETTCTLRQAVTLMNSADLVFVLPPDFSSSCEVQGQYGTDDEIVFAPDVESIQLEGPALSVDSANLRLRITGRGQGGVAVSGDQRPGAVIDPVIKIVRGTAITLTGLTISGGNRGGIRSDSGAIIEVIDSMVTANRAIDDSPLVSADGAGIYSKGGLLRVLRSSVTDNVARTSPDFGPQNGGGIYSEGGDLQIFDSTISGNQVSGFGGGVYFFNGQADTGQNSYFLVVNSTFSGNQASNGSAIASVGLEGAYGGVLSMYNSTVTENLYSDFFGGAIYIPSSEAGLAPSIQPLRVLSSSIVTRNLRSGGALLGFDIDFGRPFLNVSGQPSPGVGFIGGANIVREALFEFLVAGPRPDVPAFIVTDNCDPRLLPLDSYGGPTQTHALPFDSCALDRGEIDTDFAESLMFDQRGSFFARNAGGAPDVGAYEFQGEGPLLTLDISSDAIEAVTPGAQVNYEVQVIGTSSTPDAPSPGAALLTIPQPDAFAEFSWTCTGFAAECPRAEGSGPIVDELVLFDAQDLGDGVASGGGVLYEFVARASSTQPLESPIDFEVVARGLDGGGCFGNSGVTETVSAPPCIDVLSSPGPRLLVTMPDIEGAISGEAFTYSVLLESSGSEAASGTRFRLLPPLITDVSGEPLGSFGDFAWVCEGLGGAVCPAGTGEGVVDVVIETFPPDSSLRFEFGGMFENLVALNATSVAFVGPTEGGGCLSEAGDTVGTFSACVTRKTFEVAPPRNTSSVVLTSSPNPSLINQNVRLTAAVTGDAPTGTVQFLSDGVEIDGCGSVQLQRFEFSVESTAVCDTSFSAAGEFSLTAVYSGDTANSGATSEARMHQVGRVSSTVMLTSSLNPSTLDAEVILEARVSGQTPTGTVRFVDGATEISGCASVPLQTSDVSGVGTRATCRTRFATAGTHPLTAVYSGDDVNVGASSETLNQQVNRVTTNVLLTSSPNPSVVGRPVGLLATVAGDEPTGTVTFFSGQTEIEGCGSVQLQAGSASCSTAFSAPATYLLSARYSGDATNSPSETEMALQQVVRAAQPTTTVLTSSPNPSVLGASVSLEARVTGVALSGTVSFFDGTAAIAGCSNRPFQDAAGDGLTRVARCSTTALAAGERALRARYSGDVSNLASDSVALSPLHRVVLPVEVGGGTVVTRGGRQGVLFDVRNPSATSSEAGVRLEVSGADRLSLELAPLSCGLVNNQVVCTRPDEPGVTCIDSGQLDVCTISTLPAQRARSFFIVFGPGQSSANVRVSVGGVEVDATSFTAP